MPETPGMELEYDEPPHDSRGLAMPSSEKAVPPIAFKYKSQPAVRWRRPLKLVIAGPRVGQDHPSSG